MIFNHSSKILFDLLFPEFEKFIQKIKKTNYALSPLSEPLENEDMISISYEIKSLLKTFQFFIVFENFSSIENEMFKNYLKNSLNHRINLLQIILKKNLAHEEIKDSSNDIEISKYRLIQISIMDKNNESFIKLYLPLNFLKLFHGKIDMNLSCQELEDEIVKYFLNPRWAIPDLEILLKILSEKELSFFFNKLKQEKLLTTYQLFLLTKACSFVWQNPDLNLKIKKSLSKNQVYDVVQFGKFEKDLKIRKRDIFEGIYSIEEGIYFLFQKDYNIFYSAFLKETEKTIKRIINYQLMEIKSFDQWIFEILEKGLMYDIISTTKEVDFAIAISKNVDKFLPILSKHISQSKIESILKNKKDYTYLEWIESQVAIIKNYRKVRFNKTKLDHNSFEYLILSFLKPEDFNYLINNVGWFVLSTALKGVKRKIIDNVTSKLSPSAKNLIDDVQKGTLNPNILHDEIQINKARMVCVKAILSLYEDGLIKLDIQ